MRLTPERANKKVRVSPDSELATLLAEARKSGEDFAVDVDTGDDVYPVKVVMRDRGDIWAGYDAARVREAVNRYAGTVPGDQADEMIAAIYRARGEGSRPADRP